MIGRIIIQTERPSVVMKELISEDARSYFALIDKDRPHFSQHGDQTAKKYPSEKSVLESIRNPANPDKLRLGIWDYDTFVGMVGLTSISHNTCETGGWTGKQFCRKGYATVTRHALANYAAEKLGYEYIRARASPSNQTSRAMLEKVGFTHVRTSKRWCYYRLSLPLRK